MRPDKISSPYLYRCGGGTGSYVGKGGKYIINFDKYKITLYAKIEYNTYKQCVNTSIPQGCLSTDRTQNHSPLTHQSHLQ